MRNIGTIDDIKVDSFKLALKVFGINSHGSFSESMFPSLISLQLQNQLLNEMEQSDGRLVKRCGKAFNCGKDGYPWLDNQLTLGLSKRKIETIETFFDYGCEFTADKFDTSELDFPIDTKKVRYFNIYLFKQALKTFGISTFVKFSESGFPSLISSQLRMQNLSKRQRANSSLIERYEKAFSYGKDGTSWLKANKFNQLMIGLSEREMDAVIASYDYGYQFSEDNFNAQGLSINPYKVYINS